MYYSLLGQRECFLRKLEEEEEEEDSSFSLSCVWRGGLGHVWVGEEQGEEGRGRWVDGVGGVEWT